MARLAALHVGRGSQVGAVTLFPVWAEADPVETVVTGPDARMEVCEVGEDGAGGRPDVGHLTVTNVGSKPALLVAGELLEGGWQTRTLVYDVLIGPSAKVTVEVACVEQDRWGGAGHHARRARRVSPSVHSRLLREEESRQGAVWHSVSAYGRVLGQVPTGSLGDYLDRSDAGHPPREDVKILPGQSGVVVGVAGWPVAIELFGSSAALAAYLPGIVDAALLDARLATHEEPVPSWRARDFAAAIGSLDYDLLPPAAGEGRRIEARQAHVALRGITDAGAAVLHLNALNLRHELIGADQ